MNLVSLELKSVYRVKGVEKSAFTKNSNDLNFNDTLQALKFLHFKIWLCIAFPPAQNPTI